MNPGHGLVLRVIAHGLLLPVGQLFPLSQVLLCAARLFPHTPSLPCCPCYQKGGFSELFLLPTGSSRISRPTRHEGSKGTLGKLGLALGRLALAEAT